VGANNGVVRALALDSGRERWRASLSGTVKTTAVLVGATVYVSTGAGKLDALEAGSGRILWETALSGTAKGSPSYVPDDDLLIVGSNAGVGKRASAGQVQAVSARDGHVVWTAETDLGDMRASPTIVATASGAVAWMSCAEQAICAFAAANGEVRDRLAVPAAFTGTPTLHGGRLYVTLFDGGLLAFATKQSREVQPK
jgi:outer membrane protein assembly factor BamB